MCHRSHQLGPLGQVPPTDLAGLKSVLLFTLNIKTIGRLQINIQALSFSLKTGSGNTSPMLPSAEVRGTPRPKRGVWVSPAPPHLLASLGLSSWDVGTGWRGEDSIEPQVSNSLSPVGKVRATPAFEVSSTTLI